jgi:hypothetical protein
MKADLNEQIRELIDGGARPVSLTEIAARAPVTSLPVTSLPVTSLRPAKALVRCHPRRAAASAAAAGIAAAITVALLASPAGQGQAGREQAGHEQAGHEQAGQAGTVLTAAMVRQVAAASGTALAHSGHLRITYSNVSSLAPGSRGAGTDDITFSGRNWNYVSDQTAPPNGRSVNRFAGGRLYYYGPGFVRHAGDPLTWFRETNPAETRAVTAVTAPDPRELLRVLDPAARFVRVGYQVIGGIRVEQLRATRLGHLPGLDALPAEAAPVGRVTALDVWVDSHGVVRQLHLTSQLNVTTSDRKKYLVKENGTVKVKLGPPGPVRHGVERASAWVSFLDVGQPQTITAPAHAIPVYGRG